MKSLSAYLKESTNKYDIETIIFNRYKKKLGKDYIIRRNIVWKRERIYNFDIGIYDKNEHIITIVEIRINLDDSTTTKAKGVILNAIKITNCEYGIVTDNKDFYLVYVDGNKTLISFEESIEKIKEYNKAKKNTNENDIVYKKAEVNKVLNENGFSKNVKDLIILGNKVVFKNIESENAFWNNFIIEKIKPNSGYKVFYQYTTLESLFQIINNGTQRLCGIAGMNDRSEPNFFEKLCDNKVSFDDLTNKTFLMSCSTRENDLNMWRLYGDDAKGVCIEYEIEDNCSMLGFTIHPVCYVNKDDIDTLKKVINKGLYLTRIGTWKHFFKPVEFKEEQEVRVLFIRGDNDKEIQGGWMLNNKGVINPYVEFNLFDESKKSKKSVKFPLEIKSILLGPNCYEADTNIRQLNDLIKQKYEKQIPIDKSSIDIYRSK